MFQFVDNGWIVGISKYLTVFFKYFNSIYEIFSHFPLNTLIQLMESF